jgi:hypothetical protein
VRRVANRHVESLKSEVEISESEGLLTKRRRKEKRFSDYETEGRGSKQAQEITTQEKGQAVSQPTEDWEGEENYRFHQAEVLSALGTNASLFKLSG